MTNYEAVYINHVNIKMFSNEIVKTEAVSYSTEPYDDWAEQQKTGTV